jgi:response regulator RpfG family c-di-GMP phosphodiesterase
MEAATPASILLVDDEQQVLDSLAMNLKRRYQVFIANSGAKGLERLESDPAVAVIVSDMRMPGMDGAAFLAQARRVAPAAVRMLLTGQADTAAAIAAVNEGQIFRFLTKPIAPPALLAVIEAAVAQHRLVTAEKVLLEQTLRGSLQSMSEILALANPQLFGRASRVKQTVSALRQKLNLPDSWQLDVGAMLAPIAQISLPPETAEKLGSAAELSAEERSMVGRLPEITDRLLAHIPRLETVRVMLAKSMEPYRQSECIQPESEAHLVNIGSQLIKAAVAYDALTHGGLSGSDAVGVMRGQAGRFDHDVLEALNELYGHASAHRSIVEVPISRLAPGMVLAEDLKSAVGTLLVARGFEVTSTFLERIRNFKPGALHETIRVVRDAHR